MISAASKAVLISFANLEQSEQFPQQDDIYLPKMRQHGDSWLLGLDLLNRCETLSCISSYYQSQELVQAYLHIRNTIDNWINLPLERASILNLTLASTDLHLPIRVEEIRTRQNSIRMVQRQHTRDPHETQERVSREWRQGAKRRRQIQVRLSPTDSVIPNLQLASALDLADDAIGSAHTVVGGLEYGWHLLGDGNRVDEQGSGP